MSAAIVIDNGSGLIKAGYAGGDTPTTVIPNIVGRIDPSRVRTRLLTSLPRDTFLGDEAQKLRGILSLSHVVDRGVIRDWESMELLWDYMITARLKTKAYKHNVMITANAMTPKKQHIDTCESLFETFRAPAVNISNSGWLAMMAVGGAGQTGIVVDVGDSQTTVTPIYHGLTVSDSVQMLNYGGRDVTSRLIKLIATGSGVNLGDSSAKREIAREIKELGCFVSYNYLEDVKQAKKYEKNIQLPDSSIISLADERFCAPEILFNPKLGGLEHPGLHQMVAEAAMRFSSKRSNRKQLLEKIVLTGGSSAMVGFELRFIQELRGVISRKVGADVLFDRQKCNYQTWLGGSKVAAAANCIWLTKTEYAEYGSSIIPRKFSLP